MGAPQTLPANFDQWDQAPATLPADFNQWDEPKQAAPAAPPSALSRFGSSLLSGLGVVSNEDAKNFFEHPIHSAMNALNAQGDLAMKARDAYNRGDYKSAVIHGINYLLPFVGQQTDQAGQQLSQGDYAGGIGRTLGAALPIAAGSPEVQSAASDVAHAAGETGAAGVRAAAKATNAALKEAPGAAGAAVGGYLGHATGIPEGTLSGVIIGRQIGKAMGKGFPDLSIPGEGFGFPNRVEGGPATIPPEASAEQAPGSAGSMQRSVVIDPTTGQPEFSDVLAKQGASGNTIPRTLSGDQALRQVLTGQDNANLLKIAKSRGINVTKESQLKPGAADNLLINKIIDDHSPEELDNIGAQYLENSRFRHAFGDIGPEAWKTMSLQSYFPDLKIPAAKLARTARTIAAAPSNDLTGILQQSLAQAKARQ